MATVQRIKILGVLVLVVGAMSISAAGALGLIAFQVPQAVSDVWNATSEIVQWSRWLIVAVVATKMLIHRSEEAE